MFGLSTASPTACLLLALLISAPIVNAAGPEIGLGRAKAGGSSHNNGELTRRSVPASLDGPGGSFNLFGRAEVDDHTCAKGRPCKNGACCGSSGACGYGPVYCGIGCSSNCDAKAECGQYSADGKTECPLNVCCSQYGFCGTTEVRHSGVQGVRDNLLIVRQEFCDPASGCQSHCGNPKSPGSGGNVRTQIIGYYESWRAGSTACGALKPSEIPVSALNILNFAFAYISPNTVSSSGPMVGLVKLTQLEYSSILFQWLVRMAQACLPKRLASCITKSPPPRCEIRNLVCG